jgi:dipeptidyl aminopeptidase/acylaminoacyl peptidase
MGLGSPSVEVGATLRNWLWLAALSAALAIGSVSGAMAAARPFTAKDMAMLDRASDPRLSPDGRFLVWDVRSTDWAANKGTHALWISDRKAAGVGERKLAVSDKGATSPRWSPDGTRLYFLSSRAGTQQVWRTDADGVEAVQVTNLPVDVANFRLGPDGKSLVIAADVFADCADLACTKARLDARKAGGVSGATYDHLPFIVWDSWRAGTVSHLYALMIDSNGQFSSPPVNLMKGFDADSPGPPFGDDGAYAIVGGGKTVVFSALPPGVARGVSEETRLYAVPIDGSAAAPRMIGPTTPGAYGSPTASADAQLIAFTAKQGYGGEDIRAAIDVLDMRTGAFHEIDVGFDRSADKLAWSADGVTIYATFGDTGQERLAAVDEATGRVTMLTDTGHVGDLTVAGDRVVFGMDNLASGEQLYQLAKGGPPQRLSRVGAEALSGVAFSPYEQFSFAGWNGETVHGYVMKPFGYQEGHKYPVAFLIHGGPHGAFGDAWSYRWNPQVWAGMGYAVVMVDFHGSSGYGEAFASSIVGHWGDRPLEDLQKGWAAALARYPYLDAGHACALGGSYGGYMVAWIAGAWNQPWKCLVDHDGIFDTRSMAYSTDIPGFSEHETGGLGWQHPADVERFNPLARFPSWSKPILIIHGGRDYRVPIDQGLAAFTAAQRKGVPSQLLYFPDENHWVLKPQNSVEWYRVVGEWMHRWTADGAAAAAGK